MFLTPTIFESTCNIKVGSQQVQKAVEQPRKKHAIYIKSKKKNTIVVGSPTSYEMNPPPDAAAWWNSHFSTGNIYLNRGIY